jgi:hypothetical protein
MLPYAHSGPADLLSGAAWDASVEGSHNFHDFSDATSAHAMDAEDFSFSFVQPGAVQEVALEDYQNHWTGASVGPVNGEPMRRALSRSSTSSTSTTHKYRISKISSPKSRRTAPGLSHAALAGLDFSGSMSPAFSSYQTSPVIEQALFLDTDVPAPFCHMMADGLALDINSMHVDPTQITQMRMETAQSPCTTWETFSSPISRTSSPDGWPVAAGISSSPSSQASPLLVAKSSPRYVDSGTQAYHRACSHRYPLPSRTSNLEHSMLDDDFNGSYLAMMRSEDSAPMQALGSRRPSNNDGESARDHPYYKMAAPAADGLYHCPFEGDPSCNHKPEKLKCNYDKFVDSHLKPYRCKNKDCSDARFSSTACLLRHEREAHAMHGHGEKPFLCAFEGCERAVPGNGFPRQWNLRDHMRRVHHVVEPALLAAATSQGTGSTQSTIKARKRKGDSEGASRKASAKAADAAAKAAKALNNEWRERHATLAELLPRISGPEEENVLDAIQEARRQLENLERLYGSRRAATSN